MNVYIKKDNQKYFYKIFIFLILMLIVLTGCSTNFNTDINKNLNVNEKNSSIPIFIYHSISDEIIGTSEQTNLKVEDFKRQMKYIYDNNIKTIFLDELDDYKYSDEKVVILTFDDGYKNFYTEVYPIIKEYNIKTNLFMITSYTDERYINYLSEDQLVELDSSGLVRIGSHTKSHYKLSELSYSEAYKELEDSKIYLEELLNKEVNLISYPYGNYNSRISEMTKKIGYKYAVLASGGLEDKNYDKFRLKRVNVPRKMKFDEFVSLIQK